MTHDVSIISSLQNPYVKQVVKMRRRSHRDEAGVMIVEGCRELKRAVENRHYPTTLFFCREFFAGSCEDGLVEKCRQNGAAVHECKAQVFRKMAYGDRPEGLLGIAPQVKKSLADLRLSAKPLIVAAEAIEKPGNLGTILRAADGAGADAVIVCDRCTDINNPNVVRTSIGTLFSIPVVEADSAEALQWVRSRNIQIVATSPHTERLYTEADMTKGTVIVVGCEQAGLSGSWLEQADVKVRIPMLGQGDSLNVASAATILLYESVRQRGCH